MRKLLVSIAFVCFLGMAMHAFAYDACNSYTRAVPCAAQGQDYTDVAIGHYAGYAWVNFFSRAYVSQVSYANNNLYYNGGSIGSWQGMCRTADFGYNSCNSITMQASSAFGVSDPQSTYDFGLGVPAIPVPNSLTIVIDPLAGGNVTGDGISCNVDESSVCQYSISQVDLSSLQANANCNVNGIDYAFGYWKETDNPHSLSLYGTSSDATITAKFFKTFRNAATGGYRKSANDQTGGECLDYVEYETDIPNDVCTYSAVNCLGQANSKGYATGNTPKVGAIVIYSQGDGLMNNGHAAIVTNPDVGNGNMSIHDSNWHNPPDGVVRDRTVSINDANIMGYIYPTP